MAAKKAASTNPATPKKAPRAASGKATPMHEFTLAGHRFTCNPAVPIGALLVYLRRFDGTMVDKLRASDDLVRGVIPEAQHAAWDTALNKTRDANLLLDIATGLIEASSRFPTQASAS